MFAVIVRRLWFPVSLVVIFIAVVATGEQGALPAFLAQAREAIETVGFVGLFLSCAFLISRLLNVFFWDNVVSRWMGRPVPRLVKDVAGLVIFLCAVVGIVGVVFDKDVTGIWATSGVLTLVLGLALQSMILDVFTGIAINIDAPFQIGDWILIHGHAREGHNVGQLVEVNWRTSRLLTEENNIVMVPNRLLGDAVVTNYSRPTAPARFEVVFGLDLEVPIERARRVLLGGAKAALLEAGFVASEPRFKPEVLVKATTNAGVEYLVRYWITPWQGITPSQGRDRIHAVVMRHLEQAGLPLAWPKQDLYITRMPDRLVAGSSLAGRKALLERVPLFTTLHDDEVEFLAEGMTSLEVAEGTDLLLQGESGDSMFILAEGLLHVRLDVRGSGVWEQVAQLEPGQFFGEMSLLTGEPRSATIRAATDAVVYEIRRESIGELLEKRPALVEEISRIVAARRLSNVQAREQAAIDGDSAEAEQLSRQITERMRKFFRGLFTNE